MKEKKEEEKKVDVEDNDMPDKKLSMPEFTKMLGENIGSLIDNKLKDYDKVERKHKVFPSKEDPNGDEYKKMPKEDRWKAFITACVKKDKVHLKALAEGVAADGGYLVPDDFRAEIVKRLEAPTRMRSLVRVIPTSRDNVKIPAQDGHVKVYWATENSTKTSTSMNFDEVSIDIDTLAGLLYMSEELLADSAINLMPLIVEDFANALGTEEDRVISVGSGTGQPTGIETCTISSKASGNPLTGDDIIGLYYDLPVQYSNRATWVMNTRTLRAIMTLKDSNNRYLVNDGINGQNRATLYGRPIVENNKLPSTVIYYGDWNYYILADRQQIAVKTTTEGAGTFEKDQVAVRVTERIGGQCSMGVGFRKLTGVPVS